MKQYLAGRVALALLAAGVLCLGLAPVASASGGNSDNAKLCQMGGWQNLVRSDGSSFTSDGACVSYGARGGTIGQGQLLKECEFIGGTFATAPDASTLWTCSGADPGAKDLFFLNDACQNDGGSLVLVIGGMGFDTISCLRPGSGGGGL